MKMGTPKGEMPLVHILRNPFGLSNEVVRKARLLAADYIEQLEKENFELAAGQCTEKYGVIIGTHGHPTCPIIMKEEIDAYQKKLEERRARDCDACGGFAACSDCGEVSK